MNKYDVLYILDRDLDDDTRKGLDDKISDLIKSLGGVITAVDVWGLRKFEYPINYKNEGYYVKLVFEAESGVPAEINRVMKITDGIVRCMVRRLA